MKRPEPVASSWFPMGRHETGYPVTATICWRMVVCFETTSRFQPLLTGVPISRHKPTELARAKSRPIKPVSKSTAQWIEDLLQPIE